MSNSILAQKTEYLESRLKLFTSLAANAWTPRWRNFWQGQADSIRQELKAKMANPVVRPVESEAGNEN